MANAGPGTNGSQFFITHGPTPTKRQTHRLWPGVEGLDVLMSIPARDPGNVNAPAVKIISVTIEETKSAKGKSRKTKNMRQFKIIKNPELALSFYASLQLLW